MSGPASRRYRRPRCPNPRSHPNVDVPARARRSAAAVGHPRIMRPRTGVDGRPIRSRYCTVRDSRVAMQPSGVRLGRCLRAGVGLGVEQSTIARRVSCRGIGLHGGAQVEVSLRPAEPGSGIVFVLLESASPSGSNAGSQAARPVEIPALAAALLSSSRATSLTDGRGTTLSTVEHLLATLFVFRIDNLRVEVSGAEIPMMDGSAAAFVEWVPPGNSEAP